MTAPLDPDPLDPNDVPEGMVLRKVRMSSTLFYELGAGRVIWGKPDAEGFYTPTLYRTYPSPSRLGRLRGWLRRFRA